MFAYKTKSLILILLLSGCSANQTIDSASQIAIVKDIKNNYPVVATSSASKKYFQHIKNSSQHSVIQYDESKLNAEAKATIAWMNKQLGQVVTPDPYILPHALSAAMRKMYLVADQHEDKLGVKLYKTPLISDRIWANCGSSSGALIKMLGHFDIPTRLITVWNIPTSTHALLEYYSQTFNKWVMYDPFYGVIMLDDGGVPAGVTDIEGEIYKYGFEVNRWRFHPYRITDLFNDSIKNAKDGEYEKYNSHNYYLITARYFNVVAIRYEDYQMEGSSLPGSNIQGRWIVFDNTRMADLPDDKKSELLPSIIKDYSIDSPLTKNQKFVLSIFTPSILNQ